MNRIVNDSTKMGVVILDDETSVYLRGGASIEVTQNPIRMSKGISLMGVKNSKNDSKKKETKE